MFVVMNDICHVKEILDISGKIIFLVFSKEAYISCVAKN